ncbi:hypothetical protein IM793_12200 [Pedobacter sp. MR2016-19]|uniref:hypothetical protein n=1 Tax=Pedobacter sp. MR2016-19 TaxID=2780089 RepID=UPI001875C457|nr:hypothetical protein [Pedobacter sp. MR2016-19]MBE5319924.1 hypothetical protein [Pedobacter sp. MR2016-19]
MKIIFDSNVWQIVTIPQDFPTETSLSDFEKINHAIIDKTIEPFLSETIFTIEAIKKIERQDFFSSTKPKIVIKEKANGNSISLDFNIGPNEKDSIDFDERPILKKYFDEAIRLGFKITRLPRIGGLVNNEVDAVRYKQHDSNLSQYLDKVFEVVRKIEDAEAGMTQIKNIGEQYGNQNWMKGLKSSPETDRNKIAKAAAEWADGDSVAISVALNCDFFCTRDQAKGAGSKSVLSQQNLTWLRNDYNFQTISPEELAKLL